MFKHVGLAEEDAFPPVLVRLGSMTPDMRVVECSRLHAARLEIGYVLQHGLKQELVQVRGITIGAVQGYVELERGFHGTRPVLHEAGEWTIMLVSDLQEHEAEEHAAKTWNCMNCGGPNYNTDVCRWCGNHQ